MNVIRIHGVKSIKKIKSFFNEIMHAMLVKYAYHIVRVHYFGDRDITQLVNKEFPSMKN